MKIKHLLTLLLTMATLPALAQGSGIKGKVVSRGDRAAIEQVKITLTPGERQATSDAEGRFRFDDVASGDYTLTFEADDYEPLEIKVRVDKLTKDVRSIALVPVYTEAFDDSIFAEFDTETANDTQSLPRRSPRRKTSSTTSPPTSSARCVSTCAVTIRSTPTSISTASASTTP